MKTIENIERAEDLNLYVNMVAQWQAERRSARQNKVIHLPAAPRDPAPVPADQYGTWYAIAAAVVVLAVTAMLVILGVTG